jgi:hypothetical protein
LDALKINREAVFRIQGEEKCLASKEHTKVKRAVKDKTEHIEEGVREKGEQKSETAGRFTEAE